jgi:hypothetical protein
MTVKNQIPKTRKLSALTALMSATQAASKKVKYQTTREHKTTNDPQAKNTKRTAALISFYIGIAEGGARTHDLEVDLFAVVRATRSTD